MTYPSDPPESEQPAEPAAAALTTQPKSDSEDQGPIAIGFVGWMRWMWRQLTSMRIALILLFLIALAAIPGSVVPQRNIDPVAMERFMIDHPGWGEFFDKIGLFNVFSTPWFAAIYLLLVISLIGCILPRTRLHIKAMRARPPAAPQRFERMPESRRIELTEGVDLDASVDEIASALKSRRWRVDKAYVDAPHRGIVAPDKAASVSAEKGYLRETGNLLFHVALLALLLAVALGGLFGWRGQAIMITGNGFTNSVPQYDIFNSGRLVDTANLEPFAMTLEKFEATFARDGEQRGAPRKFDAQLEITPEPGLDPYKAKIDVNHPVQIGNATVYLTGHGYAPVIEVRDSKGEVVYDAPTVFLPIDANFSSRGVVKLPDATPQLGISGIFLPSTTVDPELGPISTFPALDDPSLFLSAWSGNLGLDNGYGQSVYELDTQDLERVGIRAIRPGETWELPDNQGSVTFKGVTTYAAFDIASDPGKFAALASAVLMLLGLMMSLFIPRRRAWVRIVSPANGSQYVELAGLSRADEAGLDQVVDDLADTVNEVLDSKTSSRSS